MAEQAAKADFLITSHTCKDIHPPPAALFLDFTKAARRGQEDLWVRKRGTGPAAAPAP